MAHLVRPVACASLLDRPLVLGKMTPALLVTRRKGVFHSPHPAAPLKEAKRVPTLKPRVPKPIDVSTKMVMSAYLDSHCKMAHLRQAHIHNLLIIKMPVRKVELGMVM